MGGQNDDASEDEYRIRVWNGSHYEDGGDPDEIITVATDEPHLWQDDPYFDSGRAAFDIYPADTPATLYIYTNESVRPPPVGSYIDTAVWDGPVERGLPFPEEYGDSEVVKPFGCQVRGRVLLNVEPGLTR